MTHFLFLIYISYILSCLSDSISWYSCPQYMIRPQWKQYEDNLQCTNISIPYSYIANNKLGNFSYQLYKYIPTSSKPSSGYIWFLSGGPGQPGTDGIALLLNNTNSIHAINENNYVFIFPDHRGTGYSAPWTCPNNTSLDDITCLNSLQRQFGSDKYNTFTIDNAARDVYTAIHSVHNASSNIFLFGASYGSLWLDRILLLYPDINIKGAIYDGVLNSKTNMIYWDRNSGDIAMSYFALCELSAVCNQYFGEIGVAQQFRYFYESYNNGSNPCVNKIAFFNPKYGINSYLMRSFFWNQINYDAFFHDFKTFPFAVIYRFLRCNEYDKKILPNWFSITASMLSAFTVLFPNDSAPLHDFINYSELMVALSSPQKEIEWMNNALLSNAPANMSMNQTNSYKINRYKDANLLYSPDITTLNKISDSNHHRLLLHGTMDFNAPYFQDTKFNDDYYNRSNWNLVSFPLIGHTPTFWGNQCVWKVITSFLSNTESVNAQCVDEMPTTYDFAARSKEVQEASIKVFGVSDPFQ